MGTCPRCGAALKPGKTACWNCWAPLPPPPAERAQKKAPVLTATPATPDTSPVVHTPSAVPVTPPPTVLTPETPPLAAVIPEASAPPAVEATAPAGAPESAPSEKGKAQTPRDRAKPAATDTPTILVVPRKSSLATRLLGGAVIVLILLAGMGALYWYTTFGAARRGSSPDDIGAIYLSALSNGNTTTQQFYATDESTGNMLPNWFTVINGSVEGKAEVHGQTAKLPVVLNLNLALPLDSTSPTLAAALQRPFHIPLVLRHEQRGWQVDQLQLWQQIKQQILQIDPKLQLPADK